jgi:2'-phosphotransferase
MRGRDCFTILDSFSDGYVKLDDILKYKGFKSIRITQDDVLDVVNNCPKQRFNIKYETLDNNRAAAASSKQLILIRASQGHSLNNVEIDLEEINDPATIENCIHGTYHRHWPSIKAKVILLK